MTCDYPRLFPQGHKFGTHAYRRIRLRIERSFVTLDRRHARDTFLYTALIRFIFHITFKSNREGLDLNYRKIKVKIRDFFF